MNMQELQQLSKEELQSKLVSATEKFHHVREEVLSGKDKNHAQMKMLKKDIAQIKTCISALSHS
jgi:ribosomal protein L29